MIHTQIYKFNERGKPGNEEHLFLLPYFRNRFNPTKVEELGFQDIMVYTINGKQYWTNLFDYERIKGELNK